MSTLSTAIERPMTTVAGKRVQPRKTARTPIATTRKREQDEDRPLLPEDPADPRSRQRSDPEAEDRDGHQERLGHGSQPQLPQHGRDAGDRRALVEGDQHQAEHRDDEGGPGDGGKSPLLPSAWAD